ncbi:hypothetical protein L4X63_16100 [Geomonas sp. Red32]|uniref:tetratricopeptide repeat protein n=1 Tax=Geomonas sp. Red32 TaxID=2912856 RepID=UPI00202CCAF0|nr:hypothetical protein [Geomonas sp. Red32]MCM0083111.1 hypothetical protein [Geomonas sp. Red32]
MRGIIFIIVAAFCLTGCATLPHGSHDKGAGKEMPAALQELAKGRQDAAVVLLEKVVAEPGSKGVTDEALFRLSVLSLGHGEKSRVTSIRYLERLRREYPDSKWTQQARPLLDYLKSVGDLVRQNQNLKSHNISLSKENKELHRSINRLKNLDLQTEHKTE